MLVAGEGGALQRGNSKGEMQQDGGKGGKRESGREPERSPFAEDTPGGKVPLSAPGIRY